jgi:signal transduction histidine kinase
MMRNLISNALKFTPPGGRVTIAAQPSAAADEVLELTVSDTGLGIAAEDVTKLFKIGVQHTTPGIDQERGSGLGLILCQEMTVKNGGQIWVESEPGRGTTVRFTVPIDRPGILTDQDE